MEFAWHSKMSSRWSPGQGIFCSSFLRAYFFFSCQMWHSSFAKEGNWMATSDFQPPKGPRLAVSKSREPEPASRLGWAWAMTQYLPRDLMAWKIFLVPLSAPDGDGGTQGRCVRLLKATGASWLICLKLASSVSLPPLWHTLPSSVFSFPLFFC